MRAKMLGSSKSFHKCTLRSHSGRELRVRHLKGHELSSVVDFPDVPWIESRSGVFHTSRFRSRASRWLEKRRVCSVIVKTALRNAD